MASATVVPKAKTVVKEDAAHPSYQDMVKLAIESLKERSGSSKKAILKYITGTFGISQDKKVVAFLRTALVKGVSSGVLKQMTGTGANGSFKLNKDKVAAPKKPAVAPKKKADADPKKKADAASKKKAHNGKKAAKVASAGTPKAAPKPKKFSAGNEKTAKDTKTTAAKKTAAAKKVTASKTKSAK